MNKLIGLKDNGKKLKVRSLILVTGEKLIALMK